MVGTRAGKSSRPAASCTECQRRKQKCNRQWPCNHCQARNIPHLCKLTRVDSSKGAVASKGASRKSSLPSRDGGRIPPDNVKLESTESTVEQLPSLATKDELRNLGYMPNGHDLLFGKPVPTNGLVSASKQAPDTMSSELKNAIRLLPPKPYTDRTSGKPLTPALTCLLIRVCACSLQYLSPDIRTKLETELGEPVQSLSESYHHAAKQLSNTIAPGKGGLAQIQQLFLTSAWFKSESLFVESWHALSSCIHEAQELGMHKKHQRPGLSEFEIEMRRRLWCLLYVWDWQMSLLLSRPLVINQSSCAYELPNMQLEITDPANGPPSPVSHIASQCELGQMITRAPATIRGTSDDFEADSIKANIEAWMKSLPRAYQENNPDTRWDEDHIYVPLQRRQMHAIGYMTMLLPFKGFLAKTFDSQSSSTDRARRSSAIEIALHLMEVSHRLFDQVFPINAKFHLVTFLIFDTAAFLCSAVIHDKDNSLPRRDSVFQAIHLACSLLAQLAQVTKTGAICHPVLEKLARSLSSRTATAMNGDMPNAALGNFGNSSDSETLLYNDTISPESMPSSLEFMPANEMFLSNPASLDLPSNGMETLPIMGVGDFSGLDVGQFDEIWDWQNLDLTLLSHTK